MDFKPRKYHFYTLYYRGVKWDTDIFYPDEIESGGT